MCVKGTFSDGTVTISSAVVEEGGQEAQRFHRVQAIFRLPEAALEDRFVDF